MRVERFDYGLPPDLIAQAPSTAREGARMLVVPPRGEALHRSIADLAEHVAPGTLVVVNDTRVLRARILGTKEGSGGKCEVFLVRKLADDAGAQRWRALGRASKGLRAGARIVTGALIIDVEGKADDGLLEVRVSTRDGSPVADAMRVCGRVPLPPYIKRAADADDTADDERYQTVFARHDGAVAAPTAGLHLTKALLARLEERACEIASCTLHVGLGTFQPVVVDDLDDHPMHAEQFEVPQALVDAIARARQRGAPVLAIGTTVVRALESSRDPDRPGHVRANAGDTRLLIQPGHAFGVIDRLLTNFHLPKSTLLALVCAFAGTERVLDVYATAIRERYRFFSYGDAMLLDREEART